MDEIRGLIPAYVAGSLNAESAARTASHLEDCAVCQAELVEWQTVAEAVQQTAEATAPSRGLLDRAFAKIDERGPTRWQRWWAAHQRPVAAGLVAAALAGVAVVTPVGSLAQVLRDVFQPKQFVVVPVSPADLKALPSLNDYGEFSQVSHGEAKQVSTVAEVAAASGVSLLTPGTLPAGVPAAPSAYQVMPSFSATFAFSAAKAAETAKAKGTQLPAMPSNIDGSSVQLTTGNAVVALYGGTENAPPSLLIGQGFAPTATSTGASAKELQQYLLSLPGFPEDLAKALKAIGDPTTTWPIPVPVGKVNSRTVTVQGVSGTAFSDDGGFMTGVVWLKGGMIYGVGGPLTESDVLRTASSLR